MKKHEPGIYLKSVGDHNSNPFTEGPQPKLPKPPPTYREVDEFKDTVRKEVEPLLIRILDFLRRLING